MSRQTITKPSIVVGNVNGALLVWTEGVLTGTNKIFIREAKRISRKRFHINLTLRGPKVEADLTATDNPEKVVAAMLGAFDGQGRILEAPQQVFDLLPPLGDVKNIY